MMISRSARLDKANVKTIHFNRIDSTNNWAKAHAHEWSAEGVTLITASEQTAGRGRYKRKWVSPPGVNIYATYCFWLHPGRKDLGNIPQLLALAAAVILEERGFAPKIKWPNDLVLNGKKLGGILCETISERGFRGVVCGIGLNVNMAEGELSAIDRPATSLFAESSKDWPVQEILNSLSDKFVDLLEEFMMKGFEPFFSCIKERSLLQKGDAVRLMDYNHVLEGIFEALDPTGGVQLRLLDGSVRTFFSGEIA